MVDLEECLQYNLTTAEFWSNGERRSISHEENLSTTQSQDEENSRLSRQNENQGRTRSLEPKEKEGAQTSHGVIEAMESLTRKGDFVRVFQQGKRKRAGLLKFFFLERKDGDLRVAFVGKSKKAVCRNRVRRRLREAFRVHFYPQWQKRPVDFIFWGDERLCSVDFTDIQSWMGQLLEEVPVSDEDQRNRED